jgi:hypothetical protein
VELVDGRLVPETPSAASDGVAAGRDDPVAPVVLVRSIREERRLLLLNGPAFV